MLYILFNGHYFLGQIGLTFNLIQPFIKLKGPGETFTGHPHILTRLLLSPPQFVFWFPSLHILPSPTEKNSTALQDFQSGDYVLSNAVIWSSQCLASSRHSVNVCEMNKQQIFIVLYKAVFKKYIWHILQPQQSYKLRQIVTEQR